MAPFRSLVLAVAVVLLGCGSGTASFEARSARPNDGTPGSQAPAPEGDREAEEPARPDEGEAESEPSPSNPSGAGPWTVRLGREVGDRPPEPRALAVTDDGDVLVGISIHGTVELGGREHQSNGGSDALLARLGRDGEPRWAVSFGGPGPDAVLALAADDRARTIAAGLVTGDRAPGSDGADAEDAGTRFFVVALGPDGRPLWHRGPASSAEDGWSQVEAVAVDSAGDVLLVGSFRGTMQLGEVEMRTRYWDGFVAKLGGDDGEVAWARQLRSGHSALLAVAAGPQDDVVVAGRYRHQVDGGTGIYRSKGGTDVVVARYAPDGTPRWVQRWGGKANEDAHDLQVTQGGDVVLLAERATNRDDDVRPTHPGPRLLTVDGERGAVRHSQRIDADALAKSDGRRSWVVTATEREEQEGDAVPRIVLEAYDAEGERVERHSHRTGSPVDAPLFAAVEQGGAVISGTIRAAARDTDVQLRTTFITRFMLD